jgi:lipoyl(octanoyl) transferase
MSPWKVLDTGKGDPAGNMALDEALLEASAKIAAPVLRFYGWTQPAATFGYFQRYAEIAAWTPLRPLIRRPTGGGLVPHNMDWTYSVIIPPDDPWYELRAVESYRRLHEWLAFSLRAVGIPAILAANAQKEIPGQCFAGAERHDLLVNGRKVAGAAQRRAREGLLIQGSVQNLNNGIERSRWHQAMTEALGHPWEAWSLPAEFQSRAAELAEGKFSQAAHNERR